MYSYGLCRKGGFTWPDYRKKERGGEIHRIRNHGFIHSNFLWNKIYSRSKYFAQRSKILKHFFNVQL